MPVPRQGLEWTSTRCLMWCRAAFSSSRIGGVDFARVVGQGTRNSSVGVIAPGSGPTPRRSER